MNEESSRRDLSGLRIDRQKAPPPSGRKPWLLVVTIVAGLLAVIGILINLPSFSGGEIRVRIARASYASNTAASSMLTASGYVVAQRQAAVSSKATGRLVYLGVEEGDRVKEGDILGRVESEDVEAELARMEANVDVATGQRSTAAARLKEAQLTFARVEDLLKRKLVSQAEYDNAEAALRVAEAERDQADAGLVAAAAAVRAARVAVENTRIRAPFDGTVLTKTADVGEMVAPFGSAQSARGAVVTMADMESLEVEADVSESNIQRIRVGAPTEIVLDAYPSYRYTGRVKKIVPTADRAKATVMTKVEFVNRDERVLPEMSAKVMFHEPGDEVNAGASELTVPAGAVVEDGDEVYVFLRLDDTARRRPVTVGRKQGGRQVIEQGLTVGDEVIVDPPEDLADGDRVVVE
jgi:RND family efflux transporter MFP subunit